MYMCVPEYDDLAAVAVSPGEAAESGGEQVVGSEDSGPGTSRSVAASRPGPR